MSSSIVFEVELLIKKKSRKIVSQANSVTHLETRKKNKTKNKQKQKQKQKQNKKQNHIKYIRFSMYFFFVALHGCRSNREFLCTFALDVSTFLRLSYGFGVPHKYGIAKGGTSRRCSIGPYRKYLGCGSLKCNTFS